ncbi:PspC domain-containing protein [Leuconostocaceae bacterium ESL0958]|nr:PspC domain-containing protein [Leuconostocaceae bacterium ESL0958]
MTRNRLYRSNSNRILGGVLGGIADYCHWSAGWLRLAFVISLMLGISPLLYLLAWLLIPTAPSSQRYQGPVNEQGRRDVTDDEQYF